MTEQTEQRQFADVVARIEQAAAEIKITGPDLEHLPRQLTELVTQAGFQASTGTIAFAGQYASGSYAVQYNDQNGGFSSSWPLWAFELAKAALLSDKGVWVASNGDPFGANLVFVMILP
jgi:hypothetical protein